MGRDRAGRPRRSKAGKEYLGEGRKDSQRTKGKRKWARRRAWSQTNMLS